MGTVADVDPVAITIAALRASPVVLEELGGPEHVTGLNEPPYPHLRVISLPGGDDGRLLWTVTGEVQVEVWGHPDGRPGKAELRRLLYEAVTHVARLADTDEHVPGQPVVVDVVAQGTARWAPDITSGQPMWAHRLLITAHPDNSPA